MKAECLQCHEILISTSQHDFQQCQCENKTMIDGGGDIGSRYGGVNMSLVKIINGGKE